MRRLTGITAGLAVAILVHAGPTIMTGAQQAPSLTCNPATIPSTGPSVRFTCSLVDFPPSTPVAVSGTFGSGPRQLTTDGAGQAGFTFIVPEFGVCAQLYGALTVEASGGGVEASTTIAVTPVPLPPLFCGPTGVPAQPRLTG